MTMRMNTDSTKPLHANELSHTSTVAKGGHDTGMTFYLERQFFQQALALRLEFEQQIIAARDLNGGLTQLAFAFCDNSYQFLTASGERLFSTELLDLVIGTLREWASKSLGLTHISSPQARVYVGGCSRKLLRDDFTAPWHYVLYLGNRPGTIRLLSGRVSNKSENDLTVHTINKLRLAFNDLLVHPTSDAYSVDVARSSMNPIDGGLFLDGYLW